MFSKAGELLCHNLTQRDPDFSNRDSAYLLAVAIR